MTFVLLKQFRFGKKLANSFVPLGLSIYDNNLSIFFKERLRYYVSSQVIKRVSFSKVLQYISCSRRVELTQNISVLLGVYSTYSDAACFGWFLNFATEFFQCIKFTKRCVCPVNSIQQYILICNTIFYYGNENENW